MFRFFRRASNRAIVDALYGAVMAAARAPALYLSLGAPDTAEGRFAMLVCHAGGVLRRLHALGEAGDSRAAELGKDLSDAIFRHLDHMLREQGVGDLAVPKRMKRLAEQFYGSLAAYEQALAGEDERLAEALARNMLGEAGQAAGLRPLAAHIRAVYAAMAGARIEDFVAATPPFPLPGR